MRSAALLLACAALLPAQPTRLANAQLDKRDAAAGLEAVFRPLVTAQPQPAWVAYSVPAARGRRFGCDSYSNDGFFRSGGGTVHLEPPADVMILFRMDAGRVDRVRTLPLDCDMDAGGAPLHWIGSVNPAQSVALLSSLVATQERVSDSAVSAIAMHADASAEAALERFAAADQPDSLRRKSMFWLGQAGGGPAWDFLKKIVAADPSETMRERAIQSLALTRQPEALDVVIAAARNDRSPRVRGQALSWLGHEAGMRASSTITQAIENDPEREVKRRAVDALRRIPNGDGIPLLIQVARSNRDPEVRKHAMSVLGQSKDPRALKFFEEVLTSVIAPSTPPR